jgi:hypothetical protein
MPGAPHLQARLEIDRSPNNDPRWRVVKEFPGPVSS